LPVQDLLAAKRDLVLKALLKRLGQYEALVIDDLGYGQQSREEMGVLFTLLAGRYERGSVLVTSNLPFSKWDQTVKGPMTAAAAIDRRVHHSVIVELNVASYRAEAAKKAKGGTGRGIVAGAETGRRIVTRADVTTAPAKPAAGEPRPL
jgi:DNA replication protein DnaC